MGTCAHFSVSFGVVPDGGVCTGCHRMHRMLCFVLERPTETISISKSYHLFQRLNKGWQPYLIQRKGTVKDSRGHEATLMKETLNSLNFLQNGGYIMGIASRIEDISGAYQLINLLGLTQYFTYREIYPGCKVKHFISLQRKSGVDFKNMVFFDDNRRNIRDVSNLGVSTVHVPEGIKEMMVREAIESWLPQEVLWKIWKQEDTRRCVI